MSDKEIKDASLEAWLSYDASQVRGTVNTVAGPLVIAPITEDELDLIQRASQKPDVVRGQVVLDPTKFKRGLVAKSLSKAADGSITEAEVLGRLTQPPAKLAGEVARIAEEIIKLSGFQDPTQPPESDRLLGFTG